MAQAAAMRVSSEACADAKAEEALALRKAFGTFATGVTVVTAQTANGPIGMTANSFSSLSLDPPLVLWSPAKSSTRHNSFVEAKHFCIHILSETQSETCTRFAKSGHDFSQLDWHNGFENVPIIGGALCYFECEQYSFHDAGDHSLIIGRVMNFRRHEGKPLCFSQGRFGSFESAS